jgi:UDP-N-acetylmuramate dehydrogenase
MSLIKQNEPLSKYCTYRIGGPARVFFEAANSDEMVAGLEVARENNFPFFVLGGGSNVLFPDEGYPGLVLKIENDSITSEESGNRVMLAVGAGTMLAAAVRYALENSLTGLEWAAGIPGTIGGAIRGNAGAFHGEIAEGLRKVETLKISVSSIEKIMFSKAECGFSYRESIFKHDRGLVIVGAFLVLAKGRQESIKALMNEYLAKKATTQPLDYPSAGSVFVNPPGFFAAKIIEDCGFKGKAVGGAQVSEKHANFIINRGNAKAFDVKDLIAQIKAAAKEKFGVEMKEEIEII